MKCEHACALIALALVFAASSSGWAQPTGLPPSPVDAAAPPPATVPKPEPAVSALSADGPRSPAFAGSLPLGPALAWQLNGVVRLKAAYVQNDPNVTFVGRSDGFELQHARLAARAEYGSRLAAVMSLEGAIDERSRANAVNGELRVGLKDAFADIALGESLGGLSIRAGRFAILMDAEEYVGISERPLISRSLVSRGIRATEGWQAQGLLPGRSLGAAFRKEPVRANSGVALGFEVAVQNGADEFASSNDNDAVALSASLLVQLPSRGYLIAAVRYNPRTVGELPLRQNETDVQGSVGGAATIGPVELSAGAVVQRTAFDTTESVAQLAWGAYAHAMYTLPLSGPLGIGYRFGILDSSSLVLTDRVMEHTVGATWSLAAVRSRLQFNVTHAVEQADRTLSNDRIEAVVEVSL